VVSGNSRVHCTCRPISALDKLASKLSALEAPDVVPKPHANRRSSHPSRPSTANILQPVAAGTATGVAAISIAGQVDAERESVQQVNKHLERRAAAMELEAKRQARLMQPLKKAAQKETPPTDDPHLCPDSDPDCMQPELQLEAKRQARLMQPLKKAAQKETPPTDDPHLCPDSDPDCMQPELLRRRAV